MHITQGTFTCRRSPTSRSKPRSSTRSTTQLGGVDRVHRRPPPPQRLLGRWLLPYQWTGEEPAGLDDDEVALAYGARWEDDELVTYDMSALRLGVAGEGDDFINDND